MTYYEVGYWSHEDSTRILLTSKKEYNQNQFNDLIVTITKRLLDKYEEEVDSGKDKNTLEAYDNFDNLIKPIADALISDFDFEEVKPSIKFRPFGWAHTRDPKYWEQETTKDDAHIIWDALKLKKD